MMLGKRAILQAVVAGWGAFSPFAMMLHGVCGAGLVLVPGARLGSDSDAWQRCLLGPWLCCFACPQSTRPSPARSLGKALIYCAPRVGVCQLSSGCHRTHLLRRGSLLRELFCSDPRCLYFQLPLVTSRTASALRWWGQT